MVQVFVPAKPAMVQVFVPTMAPVAQVLVPGLQGPRGLQGEPGLGLSDGDKGDILIASGVMHFMRTNGSPADGVHLDDPWWNEALAAGKSIILSDRKPYLIGSAVKPLVAGTGIICNGTNQALITMSPAAGHFDSTSPLAADRYNDNAYGFIADGVDGVFFRGLKVRYPDWTQNGTDFGETRPRYVKAMAIRNCRDFRLDALDLSMGYSRGAVLYIGASSGIVTVPFIHDTQTDSVLDDSIYFQVTAIQIDGDDENNSDDILILEPTIRDILNGSNAVAAINGMQADGINIADWYTKNVRVHGGSIKRTAEAIDNFSSDSEFIGIHIEDVYTAGIKMVHGASRIKIQDCKVTRAGLYGIIMGGSHSAPWDSDSILVDGNTVTHIDQDEVWADHGTIGIGIIPNGVPWITNVAVTAGAQQYNGANYYTAVTSGVTGPNPPVHSSGTVSDGGVLWLRTGFYSHVTNVTVINNIVNVAPPAGGSGGGKYSFFSSDGSGHIVSANRLSGASSDDYRDLFGDSVDVYQPIDLGLKTAAFMDVVTNGNGLGNLIVANVWQGTQQFWNTRKTRIGLALVNGLNSNIAKPAFGLASIVGPSGAFSIGGITGGLDGLEMVLFNTTAFAMTIVNEDLSSSTANRIATLTGGNIVLPAGPSMVRLIYLGVSPDRWYVMP